MDNTNTYTVLITGASRGIGLELARQFAQKGVNARDDTQVIATCREPDNAPQLQALADRSANVSLLTLDVTDKASVEALKTTLLDTDIDILINSAGAYGPNAPLLPVDVDSWHRIFALNCVAPVHVTQQLFENIKRSNLKKIVTISSDMGSIALNTGGGAYLYRSSKAALNAAMYSLSLDVAQFDVSVAMLHPGHVKTDMGGPNAKIPVEESCSGLHNVIRNLTPEQSGSFMNWQGERLPW